MKVTITTEDAFEANCLLKAKDMAIQINSLYDDVLKKYGKYMVLTEAQADVVGKVTAEIMQHFDGLFVDEV